MGYIPTEVLKQEAYVIVTDTKGGINGFYICQDWTTAEQLQATLTQSLAEGHRAILHDRLNSPYVAATGGA